MDYSKFVFEVDEHGRTAMMKAASENNHEAIHQALLKARAHQEGEKPVVQLQAKDGGTALMSAAAHGHTQAIRELMYFDRSNKALNLKDKDGWTALMFACAAGSGASVFSLVIGGATITDRNNDGENCVDIARMFRNDEALRALQLARRQIDEEDEEDDAHVNGGAGPLNEEDFGKTPAMIAAEYGDVHALTRILQKNGDKLLNARDSRGRTAAMIAASNGDTATMNALTMKRGPSLLDLKDEDGGTALHSAACHGFTDVLDLLLKNDVDVNVADSDGWTALHYGAAAGHAAAVSSLLKSAEGRALLSVSNARGETPVDLANEAKHDEVLRAIRVRVEEAQHA